jgi:dTDP-4-dehydrorhamnose reductase
MNLDHPIFRQQRLTSRILITGGEGMLGSDAAQVAHELANFEVWAPGHTELDVTDPDAVKRAVDWVSSGPSPGFVFHCAALVNVEACAANVEQARRTIVDGARHVALACQATGTRVIYPQSFLIFGNANELIDDDTVPEPLSVYGKLKLEAEGLFLTHTLKPLIIRMAGFFGGGKRDKNFVGRIIPVLAEAIEEGRQSFTVGDRIWQPTWTVDLARNAIALALADKHGTYQMASKGEASFYEVAQVIVESLGWSDKLSLRKVDASEVEGTMNGQRPQRAVFVSKRLESEGFDLQRPWRDALCDYLKDKFFDKYRAGASHNE